MNSSLQLDESTRGGPKLETSCGEILECLIFHHFLDSLRTRATAILSMAKVIQNRKVTKVLQNHAYKYVY